MSGRETRHNLEQWHAGDQQALDALLERHLSWIRAHVRHRIGPFLRKKAETLDYVQDAMVQFLKYGPRIVVSDDRHFRALLVRIIENSLRNNYDWYSAKRRAITRENPLPSDTVLNLDPPRNKVTRPSQAVQRKERDAWIRLGMEFLDAGEREVLVLRQWEKRSFQELGEHLGISDEAARKRYTRAVDRLSEKIWDLRSGRMLEASREACL
jgi:RNA polymerase sigma-70 factor (ECF subfamily)